MGIISDREVAVFDLETTGGNPDSDRIIQFGGVKLSPDLTEVDGSRICLTIDPDYPISRPAFETHGISNDDLVGRPKFSEVAAQIHMWIGDCDLAGHSLLNFDLPLLVAEFKRHTDLTLKLERRPIFDTYELVKHYLPHSLEGAFRFYCQQELDGAHDALVDADATAKLLKSMQFAHSISGPDGWNITMGRRATFCGALTYDENGEVCIGFGQFKGSTLSDVRARDPGFLDWMMGADFRQEVKDIIWGILSGPSKTEEGV